MNTKQKVLILGGAGYIGTTLAPFLSNQQIDITVVDAMWFGNYMPDDIAVIEKDIFDLKPSDLKRFDAVIFLAGLSNDPMAEFSPKDNFIYNTVMPAYLAFLAKEAGCNSEEIKEASLTTLLRFLGCTSFASDESNFLAYGVSKLQGEQAVLALADENFNVICFRQGTVSGYSPRMRLDLAMNTMFKNALSCGEITLSNPKIWRPILGLDDLCQGY